jgi:hypothetical protein
MLVGNVGVVLHGLFGSGSGGITVTKKKEGSMNVEKNGDDILEIPGDH